MDTSKSLITKISELITNIETNYPEIYSFIDEQPVTIPTDNHPDMNDEVLNDYLESLKQLLAHHLDTHPENP